MKKNILFAIGMTALACSCNDFLDREPMDAVPVYNPQIEMFAHFKTKSSFHKTKGII